jgi:hypothetical protein
MGIVVRERVFAHILPTVGVIEACFSLVFIGYGWAVKCVKTLERLGILVYRWLRLKNMNKRKHLSLIAFVKQLLLSPKGSPLAETSGDPSLF